MNISLSSFQFLKSLSENNNRDWFAANKDQYTLAHENAITVADSLLAKLSEHDHITTASGKKSLMRIYRDVRFSKDKSPYNPRWAGGFSRFKPVLRGGYYFHLQPGGETVVGGGFYQPNAEDIKLIRNHIAIDDEPLRKVISDPTFKSTFGEMQGDQLKTAPKGFEKDHPSIDLLRYKSMYAFKRFTDKEVISPDFVENAVSVFVALRPFFDVMTEFLTTDLNGRSLL
ncbi:DUF2461 domain-containing protein [bacterium]|nr:DUF2461 domain-containing protein [bacterium]